MATDLLRVDSSARGASVTRMMTEAFTNMWRAENPTARIVHRDLACSPLPHITDDWGATFGDPTKMTDAQRRYLTTSDELIAEVIAADVILIGSPMYNFTVSWELKAWIDQIVRVGKTIRYGANGPQGLLTGRRAIVASACGGDYELTTNRQRRDFQQPYLRLLFGFLGITDVAFIRSDRQMRAAASESRSLAIANASSLARSMSAARQGARVI
jgi:FMN-dependent NADH-azoreductase